MALFSGCSRNVLFLKYADTFINYRISSDFDLSRDQKKVNGEIVEKLFLEFKMNSIPEIRIFTQKIIQEFNQIEGKDQLESEQAYYLWLLDVNQRIKILFNKQMLLVAKFVPEFSKILTSKNWTYYQNEFKEKNLELLKDKKNKSIANNYIREIFDDLTPEQESLLNAYVAKYPSKPNLRVENRNHQLNKFNAIMNNGFSSEKFELALVDRLKNPKDWNIPNFQNESDQRVEDLLKLLSKMFSVASSDQKKIIAKNFEKLTAF